MSLSTYSQVLYNVHISVAKIDQSPSFSQAPFPDWRPPSSCNLVRMLPLTSYAWPLLTTPLVDLVKTRLQQGDSQLSKKSVLLVFVRPNLTLVFLQASWHYSLHHSSYRFFLWRARPLAWHVRNINPVRSHPFLLTDFVDTCPLIHRIPEMSLVSLCTLPA